MNGLDIVLSRLKKNLFTGQVTISFKEGDAKHLKKIEVISFETVGEIRARSLKAEEIERDRYACQSRKDL